MRPQKRKINNEAEKSKKINLDEPNNSETLPHEILLLIFKRLSIFDLCRSAR